MIRTSRVLLALALAAVITPAALSAQSPAAKLTPGAWTGSVTPPGGQDFPMSFDVKTPGDTIQIMASLDVEGEKMSFTFMNAKLADGSLTFTFDINGMVISCALKGQTDGAYVGECKDPGGTPGIMRMVPPKKEGGLQE